MLLSTVRALAPESMRVYDKMIETLHANPVESWPKIVTDYVERMQQEVRRQYPRQSPLLPGMYAKKLACLDSGVIVFNHVIFTRELFRELVVWQEYFEVSLDIMLGELRVSSLGARGMQTIKVCLTERML